MHAASPVERDISALPGCHAASLPNTTVGFWIAPLVVECVFFILVIWRAVAWSRENACVPAALVLMVSRLIGFFPYQWLIPGFNCHQ